MLEHVKEVLDTEFQRLSAEMNNHRNTDKWYELMGQQLQISQTLTLIRVHEIEESNKLAPPVHAKEDLVELVRGEGGLLLSRKERDVAILSFKGGITE